MTAPIVLKQTEAPVFHVAPQDTSPHVLRGWFVDTVTARETEEELAAEDAAWDASFENNSSPLLRMAERARQQRAMGRTKPIHSKDL